MLEGYQDGATVRTPDQYYGLPPEPRRYYDLYRTENLVIKPASDYYFHVVHNVPIFSVTHIEPIRMPTEEEHPTNTRVLGQRFPELGRLQIPDDQLHFLLLHKLHHEQLALSYPSSIPDAAFVLMEGLPSRHSPWPTVVQQTISGPTLRDVWSRPVSEHEQLMIAEQLQQYDGSLHIDWAFDNFIWSSQTSTLFYIDSKPTIFRTRRRNDENKQLAVRVFVRPYRKALYKKSHSVDIPTRRSWWKFW